MPGSILGLVFANLAPAIYLEVENVERACQESKNVAQAISDFFDMEIEAKKTESDTSKPEQPPANENAELRDFILRAKTMDPESLALEAETRWGIR